MSKLNLWFKLNIKNVLKQKFINLKKMSQKDDYVFRSLFEKEAVYKFRNIIKHPNSKLISCPDTGRRFVSNDILQIDAMLSQHRMIISNHIYFECSICIHSYEHLLRIFDGQIKKDRDLIEEGIQAKASELLKKLN